MIYINYNVRFIDIIKEHISPNIIKQNANGLPMTIIKVLDNDTIDKIAAGEVIERPASAVKELVENSLDAGAKEIDIKILSAGKKLIQIVDDGQGMMPEDAELAFQRHATSKLSSIDDLDTIATMGFRGEALSSIASVSEVTIATRHESQDSGTRIVFRNGKVIEKGELGMDTGTSIKIANLFSNVPARLKFLKSDRVEMSHIIKVVTERALANPDVSFTLQNGEVEILNCRASQHLEDRFLDIFGRKAAKASVKIDAGHDDPISVHGILAKPEISKPSKDDLHIFINLRPISDRILAAAVADGYAGMLMKHRHPVGVVFIQMPPDKVDINVHPTKKQAKFSDPKPIASLLKKAVADALGNTDLIREVGGDFQRTLESRAYVSQPPEQKKRTGRDMSVSSAGVRPIASRPSTHWPPKPTPAQPHLFEEDANSSGQENCEDHEVPGSRSMPSMVPIGQILETYILAQSGSDLLIIDQHAAHERVMLERLRNADIKIAQQKLITPLTLELSPRERELVDHYRQILEDAGFTIEPFGRTTYLVRAVPVFSGSLEEPENILAMVQELVDLGKARSIETKRDEILQLIACHSSIRAGEKLSISRMKRLISEMHELDNPFNCAHGRPTIIKMTDRDLEKMFKRIV